MVVISQGNCLVCDFGVFLWCWYFCVYGLFVDCDVVVLDLYLGLNLTLL